MEHDLHYKKQQLRRTMRARIAALGPERRARESEQIVRRLEDYVTRHLKSRILIFLPQLECEPDLLPWIEHCWKMRRKLAAVRVLDAAAELPEPSEADEPPDSQALSQLGAQGAQKGAKKSVKSRALSAHWIESMEQLETGPYGLRQPQASQAELNAPELARLDLVLVPALAFAKCSGARLGKGGGYYDRFLPSLPSGCVKMGLGFSVQGLEALCEQAHDVRMDALLFAGQLIELTTPSADQG